MSYNGSGTFNINTAGQPVVTGTVISSTAFNALTADLGTGLSTAITKDGQTVATARIPFAAGINSSLVTDATNTTTGSIITAGGVGIAKALFVGTTLNVAGASTLAAITGTFNGTVGATTPAAGAFTTLSATTGLTVTGSDAGNIIFQRSGDTPTNLTLKYTTNTVTLSAAGLNLNYDGYAHTFKNGATTGISIDSSGVVSMPTGGLNSTVIGATTPAAGSFTTLNASGVASVAGVSNYLAITTTGTPTTGSAALQVSVNGVNARSVRMVDTGTSGTTFDLINRAQGNAGSFGLYDDTAGAYRWVSTPTGLAVTGTLSATGAVSGAAATFTTGTFSGKISTTQGGSSIDSIGITPTTGTDRGIIRVTNTGGDGIIGMESSVGGTTLVGSTAYDLIIRSPSGISFGAHSNASTDMRLSTTGLTINGTLAVTGAATVVGTFGVGAAPVSEKMRVQTSAGLNFVLDTSSASVRISGVNDADTANVPLIIQGSTVNVGNGNAVTIPGQVKIFCSTTPSASVEGISFNGNSSGNMSSSGSSTAGYNHWLFYNGNGIVGSISTSGAVTSYTTSSDERLKNDLGVAVSTEVLRDSLVHNFDWKASGELDRGVFAQEAVKVKPTAVAHTVETDSWGVDYSKYVPDLIVGWQDHESRLSALQADFQAYKAAHP